MSADAFNRLTGVFPTPAEAPEGYACWRFQFPDTSEFKAMLKELFDTLGHSENWKETPGGLTALEAMTLGQEIYNSIQEVYCENMIGAIIPSIAEIDNPNWLRCDGSTHNAAEYPELWSILPASLKSQITQTFTTPNLLGKFLMGSNNADALLTGGAATVTLTASQMPVHQHSTAPAGHQVMLASTAATAIRAGVVDPGGAYLQPNGGTISGSAGGGLAHENLPPFMRVEYFIVAR